MMKTAHVSKPVEFELVEDLAEIFSIFKKALRKSQSIILSSRDQTVAVKDCKLIQLTADKMGVRIFNENNLTETSRLLADVYAILLSSEASFFFKPTVLELLEKGAVFGIPKKIFRIQRRNTERLIFSQSFVFRIELTHPNNPTVRSVYKVNDLSVGGLSFSAQEKFKNDFQVGQLLLDVTFSVPFMGSVRVIVTSGIVKHVTQVDGEMLKIGIQFKNLHPIDEEEIARYVLHEKQKQFFLEEIF